MLRKVFGLLRSELAWRSRFRYLGAAVLRRWGVSRLGGTFYLKDGGAIRLRPGSTDFRVLEEILVTRVYGLYAGLLANSRAILDLGGNIGLSAIFLARAAPNSVVIAVEPDRGNFAMLVENLRAAGLMARVKALQAFVGGQRGFARIEDSGNGEWGLRMGALGERSEPSVAVVTLADLVEGLGPVSVKCDIEGSERELFSRLGEWEDLVELILLELHTELFPVTELYRILRNSAYDWKIHGEVPAGAVIVTIALERSKGKRSCKPIENCSRDAPLIGEPANAVNLVSVGNRPVPQ
jgi:FkbM family methyltransferase